MSGAVELEARITSYLSLGGLFNPEMMNHDEVRRLLIDCRAELATLRSDNERLGRELREARRAPDCTNALACQRVLNFARAHTKEFKRAKAAEAERDTLLAQVEALTGALTKIRAMRTQKPNATVSAMAAVAGAALTKEPS